MVGQDKEEVRISVRIVCTNREEELVHSVFVYIKDEEQLKES